jgi:hypothetical protein
MDTRLWHNKDAAWGMAMGLLRGLGYDTEHNERIERAMVEEALERCGFKTVQVKKTPYEDEKPATEILNAQGEEITKEEKKLLTDTFYVVKAEWAQRAKEAKEARERERLAEEARRKAEYDAVAAPFREARRLKYLKRAEAEKARKATT